MNIDIYLLFNLDIPLDYIHKLSKYYYIPENKVKTLKLGGFVYFVDKLKKNKQIVYRSILMALDEHKISFRDYSIPLDQCISQYHIFYRPRTSKITKALELASFINSNT